MTGLTSLSVILRTLHHEGHAVVQTAVTGWTLLTDGWTWEPSVLLGCAAVLALYFWLARPDRVRGALFTGGVLVILLSLVSPIDVLGDDYLFSAHMVQHLFLILIAPPLMLLGLPAASLRRALSVPLIRRAARVLGSPLFAWIAGAATLWIWHLPAFYNMALADENVHIAQHLTFLVTAAIFWWPVLAPVERFRLGTAPVIAYLFAAAISSSVLGMILTFAPPGLYPAYLQPDDSLGILALIRDGWGLSAAADQQLGGLLMWVPGGLVYLFAIFGAFARWQNADDEGSFPVRLSTSGVPHPVSTQSMEEV